MSLVSEDFMSTRLRKIVLPNLRFLFLKLSTRGNTLEQSQHSKRSTIDETLLVAALKCLGTIFSNRPTGMSLSSAIPETGSTLLPFLGDPSETVAFTEINAFEHMIRIDGNTLYSSM